jgi:hypothetical protein
MFEAIAAYGSYAISRDGYSATNFLNADDLLEELRSIAMGEGHPLQVDCLSLYRGAIDDHGDLDETVKAAWRELKKAQKEFDEAVKSDEAVNSGNWRSLVARLYRANGDYLEALGGERLPGPRLIEH